MDKENTGQAFFEKLNNSKEWYTTEEAADYLRISPGQMRNIAYEGRIQVSKLGRLNRYHIDDLRALLQVKKRRSVWD